MNPKKLLKTWDLVLLLVLLLGCAAWFLFQGRDEGPRTAVIYSDGELLQTVNLDAVTEPYTIPLDGAPAATLLVEKGRIRYLSADCPDKRCVNTGWLSRRGDTAACLPGRTVVLVTGDSGPVMTY